MKYLLAGRSDLPLPQDINGGVRNIIHPTVKTINEGDVKKIFLAATSLIAIMGMSSVAQAEGNTETLMLQFLGTATGAAWSELSAGTSRLSPLVAVFVNRCGMRDAPGLVSSFEDWYERIATRY